MVDGAQAFEEVRHRRLVGGVYHLPVHITADLCGGGLQFVLAPAGDHHPGTGLSGFFGHGQPHARTAANDDDGLVIQCIAHVSPRNYPTMLKRSVWVFHFHA